MPLRGFCFVEGSATRMEVFMSAQVRRTEARRSPSSAWAWGQNQMKSYGESSCWQQLWRGRWLLYLVSMWLGSWAWELIASPQRCSRLSLGALIITLELCVQRSRSAYELKGAAHWTWLRGSLLLIGSLCASQWGALLSYEARLELLRPLEAWSSVGLEELSSRPLFGEVLWTRERGERRSALLALQAESLPPLHALWTGAELPQGVVRGARVWLTPQPSRGRSLFMPAQAPDHIGPHRAEWLFLEGASLSARGALWLADEGSRLAQGLQAARGELKRRLLGSGEAGRVAAAICLGDARLLSAERALSLRRLGLSHLFAVSGLHVGVFALLLALLARALATLSGSLRPGWWGLIIAPLGAWALTALVDAPLSAQRASLMLSALCLSRLLAGRLSVLGALIVAAYLLTALSPWRAQSLSFQLSFCAVLGLCVMTPYARSWLLSSALASVSASLATAPIIAWRFGLWAPLSALTNLLITPLASLSALPLCVAGGASALSLCLITQLMSPQLPSGLLEPLIEVALALSLLGARLLLWWLEQLPSALELEWVVGRSGALSLTLLTLLWWGLSAGGSARAQLRALPLMATEQISSICSALRELSRARWRELYLLSALLALPSLLSLFTREEGSVTALSVGQGDASLLASGDGRYALYDSAPKSGGWPLKSALLLRGIKRLEWVAISHLHPDHYEGLLTLLDEVEIGQVIYHGRPLKLSSRSSHSPQQPQSTHPWLALQDKLNALGVPLVSAREGAQEWGALTLSWGLTAPPVSLKENDASLSLLVTPRSSRGEPRGLLLSGDLERAGERRLIERWAGGRAYVWQADHHGSDTSSGAAALDLLKPRLSLISLGAHNRYSFPHPEVIARLSARGASWLRTDLEGHLTASWSPEGALTLSHMGRGLPSW